MKLWTTNFAASASSDFTHTAVDVCELAEAVTDKLIDVRAERQLGIMYDTQTADRRRWLNSSPASGHYSADTAPTIM